MPQKTTTQKTAEPAATPFAHGSEQLSSVVIDAYNAEMRTPDGFVGDRASKRAFQSILDDWREQVSRVGDDPLGDVPSDQLSKKQLDRLLVDGDVEAAGVVQAAVEEFAQELAAVIRRFLRLKDWKGTERIALGGGLRESRVGELAIGRASVILKAAGNDIALRPISNSPDHAGLIGCAHLVPPWVLAGHDSIVAVDIGGSNIRCGIVELNNKKKPDLSAATVTHFELWKHREDEPDREDAVERLIQMLKGLIRQAGKEELKLAPFIGVGCPGVIRADGTIERGGQNLPGNWEVKSFNLPELIKNGIPSISDHDTVCVMHNDAVVQGLSELPRMTDVSHWGVLTIGTGLGNARFTNR